MVWHSEALSAERLPVHRLVTFHTEIPYPTTATQCSKFCKHELSHCNTSVENTQSDKQNTDSC